MCRTISLIFSTNNALSLVLMPGSIGVLVVESLESYLGLNWMKTSYITCSQSLGLTSHLVP